MTVSIFFAKFLSIYLIIFALLMLLRKDQMKRTVKELFSHEQSIAILGILCLIFGIAIVVSHSIWETNWKGLVTLIGYIAIIRGILRLAFPKKCKEIALRMIEGISYWIIFLIMIIIGIYLCSASMHMVA